MKLTIEEVDRRVANISQVRQEKDLLPMMRDELLWRYIEHKADLGCKMAKKIMHLNGLEIVNGWWFA